ncbi:hypothetical protein J7K99_00330 [bacterium]|nr:hypothetical protein [bacterium]
MSVNHWNKIVLCILIGFSIVCAGERELSVGASFSAVGQRYYILEQDTSSLSSEPAATFESAYKMERGIHDLLGEISGEIGTRSLWTLIGGRWNFSIGQFSTEISEKIEARAPYSKNSDVVGYAKHKFYLKLLQKINKNSISAKIWVENKNFSNTGEFYYDYDLLRSEIKYKFCVKKWNCYAAWRYSFRSVPDSADANYDRRQIEISGNYLGPAGQIFSAALAYDSRYFPSADHRGSYSAFSLWGDGSVPLGTFFADISIDAERRDYTTEDEVYYDYLYLSTEGKIEKDISKLRIGAGPIVSIQSAKPQFEGASFTETGITMSANYLNYEKLWLMCDISSGKRFYSNLPDTGSFFSDYVFVDLSVMLSLWLGKRWRAELSAFYSPQWHRRNTDDIRTSYISMSVVYDVF